MSGGNMNNLLTNQNFYISINILPSKNNGAEITLSSGPRVAEAPTSSGTLTLRLSRRLKEDTLTSSGTLTLSRRLKEDIAKIIFERNAEDILLVFLA
jgi:hypothetical protein